MANNLINQFFERSKSKRWSEGTKRTYRESLDAFDKFLTERKKGLATFEQSDVTDYLNSLGGEASTLRRHSTPLKRLYRYSKGIDLDLSDVLPSASSSRIPAWLNIDEIKKLVKQSNNPLETIIQLTYDGALRISETLGLDISDIDFEHSLIRLHEAKRKEEQIVKLRMTGTMGRLKDYIGSRDKGYLFIDEKGNSISRFWVYNELKRVAKEILGDNRAKIVHPHILRHSRLTHLALTKKMDINELKAFARHSDIRTTALYIHIAATILDESGEKAQRDIGDW